MPIFIVTIKVLLAVACLLFAGVIFFSFLKYLKKNYFPTWKFPDYISVGYAEYLFKKYIQTPIRILKAMFR